MILMNRKREKKVHQYDQKAMIYAGGSSCVFPLWFLPVHVAFGLCSTFFYVRSVVSSIVITSLWEEGAGHFDGFVCQYFMVPCFSALSHDARGPAIFDNGTPWKFVFFYYLCIVSLQKW